MKIRVLLVFGLLSLRMFSQSPETDGVPNFAPKSPEAASFLKYGDYPVDLSTGVANVNIPIYTVQAGSFSLPISLDYHPSGIRVSDEATWVGLGWNLSAGAQIILDVRDQPDEYNEAYNTIPNADDVNTFIANNPLTYYNSYYQNLKSESWIRDVYNFSSPTASGKFIVDNTSTGQITIYPPDAFKVEILQGNGFKITDQYGNIYTFSDTKEYSQTLQQYQPPLYASAWFVDKIETPKHDIIEFSYIDGGNISQYNYGERIDHIKTIIPNFQCMAGPYNGDQILHSETISSPLNSWSILYTKTKKINQIAFKDGRVLFNSESGRLDFYNTNDINTLNNGPKKLDNIEIQSKNGTTGGFTTIKKTQFYYSYFIADTPNDIYLNTHRLKLDKISNIGIDAEETVFTYSDIKLPSKNSKATDYWGYFNGAANLSRIPHQIIMYSPQGYGTFYESVGNADRRVNPLKIEAGILKEIKYPTKGSTKFEYEPNMYYGVNKLERFTENNVSGNIVQGTGTAQSPRREGPGYDDGFTTICQQSPSIGCVQYLVLPFEAMNAEGVLSFQIKNSFGTGVYSPTVTKYQYARVRVYTPDALIYDSTEYQSTITISKNLQNLNGSCVIVIEAYGQYLSVIGTQLKYYNNDTTPKNNYGMGLRIKSITNVNHTNEAITKKEYEYKKSQSPNLSSGVLINDIAAWFQSNSFTQYSTSCCNKPGVPGSSMPTGCDWQEVTTTPYNSSSISGIESNSVIYSEVKEKNISTSNPANTTNGYSLYTFSTDPDFLHDSKGLIKVETGYKRGKLLFKEVYKETNPGVYLRINKLTNEYTEDNRKISYVKGFKLFQHASMTGHIEYNYIPILPLPLDAIFEPVGYSLPVQWFYQKSSETTDYFYNSSNIQTGAVTSKTNYFYDNPNHLQLTRTEVTNSTNEILKTKLYYLDDLFGAGVMSDLKTQNRIGEVIKTETFRGTELLSVQNKVYKNWGNNIIEPEIIQASKGLGTLENRMRYNVIDNTNGNPLELQMENGSKVVYIWGYNKTQPIAKIENATYADVQSQVANLQTISDTGTEPNLLAALTTLRNTPTLTNAMVTTYTYLPLVGVSTITDPNGNKVSYTYDFSGRLSNVKDKDGNILSENEYHYKN